MARLESGHLTLLFGTPNPDIPSSNLHTWSLRAPIRDSRVVVLLNDRGPSCVTRVVTCAVAFDRQDISPGLSGRLRNGREDSKASGKGTRPRVHVRSTFAAVRSHALFTLGDGAVSGVKHSYSRIASPNLLLHGGWLPHSKCYRRGPYRR
jgi:hypothetical protein